jgi:hypothetical protein
MRSPNLQIPFQLLVFGTLNAELGFEDSDNIFEVASS